MERPTSVTVFGILHLIFGVLGICGMAFTVALFVMPADSPMVRDNPTIQLMEQNAGYRAFMLVNSVLGSIVVIALIAAGIGLLTSKAWGRTLSIVYGYYGVVTGVIGIVVNMLVVAPFTAQYLQTHGNLGGQAGASAALVGGHIGAFCGGLLGMVYPVLTLIFMYRKNVVAFFSGAASDDGDDWTPVAPL